MSSAGGNESDSPRAVVPRKLKGNHNQKETIHKPFLRLEYPRYRRMEMPAPPHSHGNYRVSTLSLGTLTTSRCVKTSRPHTRPHSRTHTGTIGTRYTGRVASPLARARTPCLKWASTCTSPPPPTRTALMRHVHTPRCSPFLYLSAPPHHTPGTTRYGTRRVYSAKATSPYFAHSWASSSIWRGKKRAT